MFLFLSVLIGVICCTNTERVRKKDPDSVIQLTPNTLNQAKFLKFQRIPLRRLPTREERRRQTGAPVLICGEGNMGIVVNHPFNGRIFASHRETDPECLQYVTTTTFPKFTTSLYGKCGVWSRKSLQPSTTDFHLRVVVSFSYEHLTEEDRIYDLTCSYSSKNISVAAYYDTVNFFAHPVLNSSQLPACHYSLRRNALDGPKTQSATLGQMVYHRWSCPSNEFAFKVYRCYVHNGLQQSYMIINDEGCSLDESILPHPTYDLTKGIVYTPSKAFRFTKSRRVHFNCMLSVCHKNDEECMKGIPPQCPRTLRKRQLPGDFSIEERLKQLHAQLEVRNYTDDVDLSNYDDVMLFEVETTTVASNVAAHPLFVDEPEFAPRRCMPYTYLHWIYALLITNMLSILIAVLACSNLLKRRFSLDIVNIRHKYRSPF